MIQQTRGISPYLEHSSTSPAAEHQLMPTDAQHTDAQHVSKLFSMKRSSWKENQDDKPEHDSSPVAVELELDHQCEW